MDVLTVMPPIVSWTSNFKASHNHSDHCHDVFGAKKNYISMRRWRAMLSDNASKLKLYKLYECSAEKHTYLLIDGPNKYQNVIQQD